MWPEALVWEKGQGRILSKWKDLEDLRISSGFHRFPISVLDLWRVEAYLPHGDSCLAWRRKPHLIPEGQWIGVKDLHGWDSRILRACLTPGAPGRRKHLNHLRPHPQPLTRNSVLPTSGETGAHTGLQTEGTVPQCYTKHHSLRPEACRPERKRNWPEPFPMSMHTEST